MTLPPPSPAHLNRRLRPSPASKIGGGNFLRGFMDWKIDRLNESMGSDWDVAILRSVELTERVRAERAGGAFYHCLARHRRRWCGPKPQPPCGQRTAGTVLRWRLAACAGLCPQPLDRGGFVRHDRGGDCLCGKTSGHRHPARQLSGQTGAPACETLARLKPSGRHGLAEPALRVTRKQRRSAARPCAARCPRLGGGGSVSGLDRPRDRVLYLFG